MNIVMSACVAVTSNILSTLGIRYLLYFLFFCYFFVLNEDIELQLEQYLFSPSARGTEETNTNIFISLHFFIDGTSGKYKMLD